jgi:hypothetical protein
VEGLTIYGMNVPIYNLQLCVLRRNLWKYARKSISDWKNVYLPECDGCGVRQECGGFLSRVRSVASRLSAANSNTDITCSRVTSNHAIISSIVAPDSMFSKMVDTGSACL